MKHLKDSTATPEPLSSRERNVKVAIDGQVEHKKKGTFLARFCYALYYTRFTTVAFVFVHFSISSSCPSFAFFILCEKYSEEDVSSWNSRKIKDKADKERFVFIHFFFFLVLSSFFPFHFFSFSAKY